MPNQIDLEFLSTRSEVTAIDHGHTEKPALRIMQGATVATISEERCLDLRFEADTESERIGYQLAGNEPDAHLVTFRTKGPRHAEELTLRSENVVGGLSPHHVLTVLSTRVEASGPARSVAIEKSEPLP